MKKAIDITRISAQRTSDRRLEFTMLQRAMLGALLGQQTGGKVSGYIGRPATEEDMHALYSALRKVRLSADEVAPFLQSFGVEKRLDLARIGAKEETQTITLDGGEARVLRAFLSGWLRADGALADRDWAEGILQACD